MRVETSVGLLRLLFIVSTLTGGTCLHAITSYDDSRMSSVYPARDNMEQDVDEVAGNFTASARCLILYCWARAMKPNDPEYSWPVNLTFTGSQVQGKTSIWKDVFSEPGDVHIMIAQLYRSFREGEFYSFDAEKGTNKAPPLFSSVCSIILGLTEHSLVPMGDVPVRFWKTVVSLCAQFCEKEICGNGKNIVANTYPIPLTNEATLSLALRTIR